MLFGIANFVGMRGVNTSKVSSEVGAQTGGVSEIPRLKMPLGVCNLKCRGDI